MTIVPHLALSGAFVLLGYALDCAYRRGCHRHTEDLLDEALGDTFPASDPTATQDFTSPDERHAMRAAASPA